MSACRFSSRPQNALAGDHTSGSALPRAIAASVSPEFCGLSRTKTTLPPAWAFEALNCATSGLSSASFSGETTTVSATAFFGAAGGVDGLSSFLPLLLA